MSSLGGHMLLQTSSSFTCILSLQVMCRLFAGCCKVRGTWWGWLAAYVDMCMHAGHAEHVQGQH